MGFCAYLEGEKFLGFGNDQFDEEGKRIKTVRLDLGRLSCLGLDQYIFDAFVDDGMTTEHDVYLSEERLDQLIQAIRHNEIEPNSFDAWSLSDRQETIQLFQNAKTWMNAEREEDKVWRSVYYHASY